MKPDPGLLVWAFVSFVMGVTLIIIGINML